MGEKTKMILYWLPFFAVCLGMSLAYNPPNVYKMKKEIRSDKAGYYAYLPAAFIYGFSAPQDTNSIDPSDYAKSIYYKDGKLYTKYPCGPALMQLPFFLPTYAYQSIISGDITGYGRPYEMVLIVAGSFYGSIGLFLFWLLLRDRIRRFWPRILILFGAFFGTNLYYYTVHEPGMSHVYTFFLFALITFIFIKRKITTRSLTWMIFLIGLLTLVRMTNPLYLLLLFMFERSRSLQWLSALIQKPYLILIAVLPWIPQFIYWHFLSGEWFYYSYEGEGFDFRHPELFNYFFSAGAGVGPITPLVILMPFLFIGFKRESLWYLASLLFLGYIFSSWHSWNYGCSFGSRPLAEYTFLWLFAFQGKKGIFMDRWKYLQIPLILILSLYTMHLSDKWQVCWYYDLFDYSALINLWLGLPIQ
jgi:hypothetical protein